MYVRFRNRKCKFEDAMYDNYVNNLQEWGFFFRKCKLINIRIAVLNFQLEKGQDNITNNVKFGFLRG